VSVIANLLTTFIAIVAGIVIYHYRAQIWGVVQRFDAKTKARHEEEARDRGDNLAHYRHTIKLADEQIEQVQEVRYAKTHSAGATPLVAYVFEGKRYPNREQAEDARLLKVREKAREFYIELPFALASTNDDKLE
jgi:hypothetical protein